MMIAISLYHLEKLFVSIHDEGTLFTLENVSHIKKMTFYMIATIIVSSIVEVLFNMLVEDEFHFGMQSFDFIQILFLFSMAYIFEYGYEIQLDSKGKIYEKAAFLTY